MKGGCPECGRTYEISDEFLAMGGKAKCPHCMLDLVFGAAGEAAPGGSRPAEADHPRSRRDHRRAPTRIATDFKPAQITSAPEEVDAFCDACNKRFKIDTEYLRMGGAAACPHCAGELRIDPSVDPRQATRTGDAFSTDREVAPAGAAVPTEDPYAEEGNFGLGSLGLEAGQGEGASPVSVEDTRGPVSEEPALETEATALPTEVMNSPFVAARELAEPPLPPDPTNPDPGSFADPEGAPSGEGAEVGGEAFQSSLDGLSMSLDHDETVADISGEVPASGVASEGEARPDLGPGPDATEAELPADEPPPTDAVASEEGAVPSEESAAPSEETAAPSEETVAPSEETVAPSEEIVAPSEETAAAGMEPPAGTIPPAPEETVEVEGLAEKAPPTSKDAGVFSGLASTDDWAQAAQRWAQSGFKAEEMPGFIKAAGAAAPVPDTPAVTSPPTVAAKPPTAEPAVGSPPTVAVSPSLIAQAKGPIAGLPVLDDAHANAVEVSDADILMLESSEVEEVPAPPAQGSWAVRAAEELKKQKTAEKPVVPTRARVQLPPWLSRLSNPLVLAAALGIVVLVVITVLWLVLGRAGDVADVAFPTEGLKNAVVDSAGPTPYRAKDEAVRHYGLGNRLAFVGRTEDAIAEYQAAQRIDPGFPHPHRALGAMFAALGKTDLALQSYEAYLRLAPTGADSAQVRQIVQRAKGR